MTETVLHSDFGNPLFQNETLDSLLTSLDNSLTRYLHLLDQYQSFRARLHKDMSNGFLDLAHANFKNPNRIHYGQDSYDERMQATVKVSIDNMKPSVRISRKTKAPVEDVADPEQHTEEANDSAVELVDAEENFSKNEGETVKEPVDPLRWFGILVPQTLRQAQQSFRSVATEDIENVLNVRLEMEELEREIWDTRHRIKERGSLS